MNSHKVILYIKMQIILSIRYFRYSK